MIATSTGALLSFWTTPGDDDASSVAERALALADGTRSIRTIADCLSDEFQVEAARAGQDLIEFFLELERAEAIELLGP
jgi:hypothetical protein